MDKNKVKLIVAVAVLVVAGGILAYYFSTKSNPGTANMELQEAAPDEVGSRAVAPGAAKESKKK